MLFRSPATIEEAKARLEEVKFKKKDLSLQKKDVMEQQRQRRAEYTENERNRATWGKGVGAGISKDFGKAARKAANVVDSHGRKSLAEDLEPLEDQRRQIEASVAELDQEKLQLDKWVADAKVADKAAKEAAKAAKATDKAAKAAAKPASPAADSVTPPPSRPPDASATASDDRIAKLKDLADLKEAGVLTEEEFQAEKKRVLEGG